jgi:hypothetical protein
VSSAPAPNLAPGLTALGFDRSTFPAAPSGPSAKATARKRKPRVYGARVSFRLTEAARVNFTVERRLLGRRVGKRCLKPTRANRTRRACVRYVKSSGGFTRAGKTGLNRFRFTGRLGGRKLGLGRYRLAAQARDATGKRSKIARRAFRIVR